MVGFFLSQEADFDLQELYLFSTDRWGERHADNFLLGLYDVFSLIAENPAIGRLRTELGAGIRCLSHGRHLIFYKEWQSEIAIVRVLHGSRDIETVFDS